MCDTEEERARCGGSCICAPAVPQRTMSKSQPEVGVSNSRSPMIRRVLERLHQRAPSRHESTIPLVAHALVALKIILVNEHEEYNHIFGVFITSKNCFLDEEIIFQNTCHHILKFCDEMLESWAEQECRPWKLVVVDVLFNSVTFVLISEGPGLIKDSGVPGWRVNTNHKSVDSVRGYSDLLRLVRLHDFLDGVSKGLFSHCSALSLCSLLVGYYS